MGALSWISDFFGFFGRLIPRILIVRRTHQGIAFVRGRKVKKLLPGITVYWPILTEVLLYPVVRQTANLNPQCLMTHDGVTVVAGGIVVYNVYDIEKALAETWDLDETIIDISQVGLRNVIVSNTLSEVNGNRKGIDKQLTQELNEQLKEFGINVIRVSIADFAKCLVIKNMGQQVTYLPKLEEDQTDF